MYTPYSQIPLFCLLHTALSALVVGVRDAPGSKVIATQSSPLLAANPNIVRHDLDDENA